jgi:hypothetical protein
MQGAIISVKTVSNLQLPMIMRKGTKKNEYQYGEYYGNVDNELIPDLSVDKFNNAPQDL